MSNDIRVGDPVAYSAEFLRNTGQITSPDDVGGGWRGVVVDIHELEDGLCMATVEWDTTGRSAKAPREGVGGGPVRINVKNLARVGSAAMYAL